MIPASAATTFTDVTPASRRYSYAACLASSEKIRWRVEDLIGPGEGLDFSRPFLPESLARVEELEFLSASERLALNQIRGRGYLVTFGLVEEFILPFVLDHARPHLDDDDHRTRALLQFASEEAKHIHLFKEFARAFDHGFGTSCEAIGPPSAIAEHVLSHSPLAVALTILHIEWMTQSHYVESVADDDRLDPRFKSLLRHHWMEEAQHAKLDALMVEALGESCDEHGRAAAVEEYLSIGAFLDEGLKQQARLDLASLERAIDRSLTDADREDVVERQHQALRWTFLGTGMRHPRFLESLEGLGGELRARVEAVAPAFD